MSYKSKILSITVAALLCSSPTHAENNLQSIQSRDYLSCAVNNEGYGFAMPDEKRISRGMAIDLCRVFASAILGDPAKVRIYHILARDQIIMIASGNYDVLIRTVEWTMQREAFLGIVFVNGWFHDSQRIAVHTDSGIKKLKDMDGATVCVTQGNNTEVAITDLFRRNNMKLKLLTFSDATGRIDAFDAGRCDALTADGFHMASELVRAYRSKGNITMLEDKFNEKIYGIAIKKGEEDLYNAMRWVFNALVMAEELGINSSNVDELAKSNDPRIKRLTGSEGNYNIKLGLRENWFITTIKAFGNYGEIYNRHFSTDLQKVNWPPRDMNRLCRDCGRICSIPIQ